MTRKNKDSLKRRRDSSGPAKTATDAVQESIGRSDASVLPTPSPSRIGPQKHPRAQSGSKNKRLEKREEHPSRRRKTVNVGRRSEADRSATSADPALRHGIADKTRGLEGAQEQSEEGKNTKTVTAAMPVSLPTAVRGLGSRFKTTTLHIATSSKIRTKVATVLTLLEPENEEDRSSIDPSGLEEGKIQTKMKVEKEEKNNTRADKLALLTARTPAANKLISVVEIAKREMESRGWAWFQYSGLHGRIEEFRESGKMVRGSSGAGRQKKGESGQRIHRNGDGSEELEMDVDMTAATGERGQDTQRPEVEDEELQDADKQDARGAEDEEGFETMELPNSRIRSGAGERKKVRTVPVLTVCLSRVRIPELNALYGEQVSEGGRR